MFSNKLLNVNNNPKEISYSSHILKVCDGIDVTFFIIVIIKLIFEMYRSFFLK